MNQYDEVIAARKAARSAAMAGCDMADVRSQALDAAIIVFGSRGSVGVVLSAASEFVDFLIGVSSDYS